ncbi:MAG TPA: hypothetical protein VG937_07195 [Polyangiaceae bacterium]|nr:hypothetical protein [Polyangiaceae bacterium]
MTHSNAPDSETRTAYPLVAILSVLVAWLGFFVLVVAGALTLMLVVVTAPAYAAALVGYSGLLSSVHEYARSRAYPVRRASARSIRATSPVPASSSLARSAF